MEKPKLIGPGNNKHQYGYQCMLIIHSFLCSINIRQLLCSTHYLRCEKYNKNKRHSPCPQGIYSVVQKLIVIH